jgi:catalase
VTVIGYTMMCEQAAFVFELSKCQRLDIRQRMVAGLRNVDENLAGQVGDGLGLIALPDRLEPARPPRIDLQPSPTLSILANGPDSFGGRKIGVLLTDGFDATALAGLQAAAESESVTIEVVAAKVGGASASDGSLVSADQKLDGAPSVVFDAVVVLASKQGAADLATSPAARDFVSDAYAHGKFIGHTAPTMALFSACGLNQHVDDGFVELGSNGSAVKDFLARCRQIRFWARL